MKRILWLAVADARGHLMRAHLARGLLAPRGIAVDIITTSYAGRAFAAALGSDARVLERSYELQYDHHQNFEQQRTEQQMLRYLLSPRRCLRDARWMIRQPYDLLINDSFHPTLLLAPAVSRRARIVHVYGENIRSAVEQYHHDRGTRWVKGAYKRAFSRLCDRAYARIEHTLDAVSGDRLRTHGRDLALPPLIAQPRRLSSNRSARRLAVVYLNPHFTDPTVAQAIEDAFAHGWTLHAVGEGFAHRAGWRATDPHLATSIANADIIVSAPGMGVLGQAAVFGRPLIALASRQPEQRRNLASLPGRIQHEVVDIDTPNLCATIAEAATTLVASALPARAVSDRVDAIHRLWADALTRLTFEARSIH